MNVASEILLPLSIIASVAIMAASLILSSICDTLLAIARSRTTRRRQLGVPKRLLTRAQIFAANPALAANKRPKHRSNTLSLQQTTRQLADISIIVFIKARSLISTTVTLANFWLLPAAFWPDNLTETTDNHPARTAPTKTPKRRPLTPIAADLVLVSCILIAINFMITTHNNQPFLLIWGIISIWIFLVVILYEPLTFRKKLPLFAATFVGFYLLTIAATIQLSSVISSVFTKHIKPTTQN